MHRLLAILIASAACALPGAVLAQGYPAKPIKIVVPFAVGGIADTFSRVIAQKVQEAWGQPVVVENKAGAGGNIGADLVAKSPPDGYTLVMGSIGTHAVNPHLVKDMPYDAQKDFVPIAHVLEAEGLLVVNPALAVKTVPELIAHLKAQPGKLSYASAGVGTASHLAGELFKNMAGVDMAHIPYKGNAPAITDVMGGQAHMIFATMPTVIQQAKAGRLRPIAVIGSARARALPETPTVAETLSGFEVGNWVGLFAPAGTPAEIVRRWNAEVQRIMASADVQPRLEAEGARFVPTTPESFAAFQRGESARWGRMIREAGIRVE
jgi:tripartite-type tricarboxylate transporter receptor subunit TctC